MKSHLRSISIFALATALAACATTATTPGSASKPDRAGLAGGQYDAEFVSWNMELVHAVKPPPGFEDPRALWAPAVEIAIMQKMAQGEEVERPPNPISFANTDLAFRGDQVIAGNWHGFNVFDVSGDKAPEAVLSVVCPGGQGDVAVHGDLVFRSVEDGSARLDCGAAEPGGVDPADHFSGVQIFDISDFNDVRQVAAVQTCRGAHTLTYVPHPTDPNVGYVYGQGTSGVRSSEELSICSGGQPDDNPDTALYSIDVIKVPLNAPENAALVNRPRIFADKETGEIAGLWQGGPLEEGAQSTAPTNHCHDITVYPEFNLAAGACSGNGILLDISDPENPARIAETSDPNMAYWHSATFNNDATKLVFTDEWGGGLGARCRPEDPDTWGADVVVDITDAGLVNRGIFKIPNSQTEAENCVAHNGSIIPVPGRDLFVQAWYSGGVSIIDFTDSENPVEIAYFDRGPVDENELYLAGNWAAYWNNGRIYAPEIVRGLDVFELLPSEYMSEAEIAAAKLIRFEEANTQTQLHFEWPNDPAVAQAYLDQLTRAGAVDAGLARRAASEIRRWDRSGPRSSQLARLASDLTSAAEGADGVDADRMRALAGVLGSTG